MRLLKQWQHVQLGSACSKIGSGATPRGGDRVYVDEGTAIIRSQNVYNGLFTRDGLVHLTEEHAEQLKGVTVEPRDVLLNITGDSVARCCQVPDWVLPARVNQHVAIVRPNTHQLLPEFLCYYFISPLMQKYLLSRAGSGGTRNALTKRMIESFEVPCPHLVTQQRIVDLLKNYDDLIENNRRRIQLLEQAARLLYKEWFVHLRFPGYEQVSIIDGVPERWSEGVVADFYSTGSGGTPSRKNPDFYAGEIPWVKTQELNGGFILSTEERITDEAVKRSSAKLFPRHTVLIAMYGATIGQTAILSVSSTTNQACCAVVPKEPGTSYSHAYLFFYFHQTDLVGLGQGAAQNNISQQVIKSFKMVLPRKEILDAFSESVSPLFNQIEKLQENNISLAKARDLLLPRLMNGELAV